MGRAGGTGPARPLSLLTRTPYRLSSSPSGLMDSSLSVFIRGWEMLGGHRQPLLCPRSLYLESCIDEGLEPSLDPTPRSHWDGRPDTVPRWT